MSRVCRQPATQDPGRQQRRGDAVCVSRLRGAGAIVLGKLSTHELRSAAPSSICHGRGAQSWNTDHHPAGRLRDRARASPRPLPAGARQRYRRHVRNPASDCGIVRAQPTYGLVSRRGVFRFLYADHVGPLSAPSRQRADARNRSPDTTPRSGQRRRACRALCKRAGARRARIAHRIRPAFPRDGPAANPEVAAALANGRRHAGGPRAEIRDIRAADAWRIPAPSTGSSCRAKLGPIHGPWLKDRPGDYGQLARRRLMPEAFLSAGDYVQGSRRRLEMIGDGQDSLRDVDVLLCASAMDPRAASRRGRDERTYPRQARTPFNVTGTPRRDDGRNFVSRLATIVHSRPLLCGGDALPGGSRWSARPGRRKSILP